MENLKARLFTNNFLITSVDYEFKITETVVGFLSRLHRKVNMCTHSYHFDFVSQFRTQLASNINIVSA